MDIQTILQKDQLNKEDLVFLLGRTDRAECQALYEAAYRVKLEYIGNVDYYRGLLEFSNRCIKNCLYCGIRRDNTEVARFDTPREDILQMARWCFENQYGSLCLQSGERQDEAFIAYVESLIRDIKRIGGGALGLTLCCGEQTEETYRRWYDAGAHRYLLRIETSNPRLYATLHPQDGHHQWQVRKDCLAALARTGWQVGTGVMIGLPGQTLEDLADDILFYQENNIAMVGMGPYVVHHAAGQRSHRRRQGHAARPGGTAAPGHQHGRRHAPVSKGREHRRHHGPAGSPSPGAGNGPESRGEYPHAPGDRPKIPHAIPALRQ